MTAQHRRGTYFFGAEIDICIDILQPREEDEKEREENIRTRILVIPRAVFVGST
jgi:hypothetical protein